MKRFLLFFIGIGIQHFSLAQSASSESSKIPLKSFITAVEDTSSYFFFFQEPWLEYYEVDLAGIQNKTVPQILEQSIKGSDLSFIVEQSNLIIFIKDHTKEIVRQELISEAAKEEIPLKEIIVGKKENFKHGKKARVKGTVRSDTDESPLVGAVIYIHETEENFITDLQGRFEAGLIAGQYTFSIQFPGFQETLIKCNIFESGVFTVNIFETPLMLDEVLVSGKAISERSIGQNNLKLIDMKRAPAFLGEVDVIKSIQLQAGVSTVSEASSGFNVRGGSVDQNLILFNDVQIFNSSHALGFFTAFNPESIGTVSFYKGGVPSEYGGRSSSVLAIQSKTGSLKNWSGTAGLGLVSGNLSINGPIKANKSSLLLSIRSTYSDWLVNQVKSKYKTIGESKVSFYDGNFVFSQKLANEGRLQVSGYHSSDQFRLTNDTTFSWNNYAFSVRYDKVINSNFFYNIGLNLGSYAYNVSEEEPFEAFDLDFGILYPSLKADFTYTWRKHQILFGAQSTLYRFQPGILRPASSQSLVTGKTMANQSSLESAFYISDAFDVTKRLFLQTGLRVSVFSSVGVDKQYLYEQGLPLEEKNLIDSLSYQKGSLHDTYVGIEPRLALKYMLNSNTTLKLGYDRMYQYLHLISNSASVNPIDIWQPSNRYFKPIVSDQLSGGIYFELLNKTLESFVEVFYKKQSHLLDFKDGANLILNKYLETALVNSSGRAYGFEVSVDKLTGKITGSLNYTYSRSFLKTQTDFELENINNGQEYPSNFDQPHILNLAWKYALRKRIFLSGNFTYHTGRPVSLPLSGYAVDGSNISEFSLRNNYRIPDYHRLDLALVVESNYKKNKKIKSNWTLSIYNVYSRKNPYSVVFIDQGGGVLKPFQLSIIGVPIPSLSYNIVF